MPETEQLTAAVVISLVAGILIVLDSIMEWPAYHAMAGTWLLGLVSGIIVMISAIMLYIRPGEATHGMRTCCIGWGSAILIFSVVSLFGASMGGLFIGAILGIIGGALALSLRPKN